MACRHLELAECAIGSGSCQWSRAVPLNHALEHVPLCHSCRNCGQVLERAGSWFKSVGRYRCAGCATDCHLTYEDKLKLFADHEYLIPVPAGQRARSSRSADMGTTGLGGNYALRALPDSDHF
jgi:hypothetical protein